MWARILELILGGWLMASPWVMDYPPTATAWRFATFDAGIGVVVFAVLSWVPRLSFMHVAHLLVGAGLAATAFVGPPQPAPPPVQNHLIVALILMILALVPTRSSFPPAAWREFEEEHSRRGPASDQARPD